MSKIDKLSILGLRSFDNQHAMAIQFFTPLTLIVGTNGSGKTTIIECLKYATTGIVPPNTDKGATFIHDAKLCGESEVLAQIKLSFKSIEGTRSVCTRSLQLTVKRASRSFKTLEGNVRMVRDGQTTTVTSKQTSLDTLMPQLMGVSRAILDGVIFCHQEESLWPLQKSSDLKVRFDQIFDAQKYTKAVEAIKVLQKNKKQELVQLKANETVAKSDNDRAKKARVVMSKLQDETEELRTQVEELGERVRQAQRKADHAWDRSRAAGEIVNKLMGKRIERQTKEESVNQLQEIIVEMTDSDEALQLMLEQYEERVSQYQEELDSKKGDYQEVAGQIQEARKSLTVKERECGAHEAEKAAHERRLVAQEQFVRETARSYTIPGFNDNLDLERIREFLNHMTRKLSEQSTRSERTREATREELQRVQKRLDKINAQKSAYNQQKDSSKQNISNNDRKIENLQAALDKISIDEGGVAGMESQLHDVQHRLQNAKTSQDQSNLSSQIQDTETELRRLEDRKEKLDVELVEGTQRAGDSARLDYIQKELKDRQRSLQTMIGAHGQRIGSIVGDDWNPSNLETVFQRVVSNASTQVTEAEQLRDGTNKEIEQIDYKLGICRSNLKAKQASLGTAALSIKQAVGCQPDEYNEEVEKLENSRDYLKADADSFKMMYEYFDACIKAAKEKNACRTCSRGLKGKEVDVLVRTVEREKKRMEDAMDNETLRETEDDLKAARAVSSDYDMWERLKNTEIPHLQTEEATLLQKKERLGKQLEDQDSVVDENKLTKREVDGLSRHVQSITKYNSEIAGFELQIQDLTTKQESTGMSRGLEAIQDDIKAVNDELRNTRARLGKLTTDRERMKSLISSLEIELRDVQTGLNAAEYQLKEKKALETQTEDYKIQNNEQRGNIKSIDTSIQALTSEMAKEQAIYDDVAVRGAAEDQELQSELNKLMNSVNQLRQTDRDIQSYYDRDGPTVLVRAKRDARQLQDGIVRMEQDQGSLVREVKALEDQLRNHVETKRSIEDNQRFRRDQRQLRAVVSEIEELEAQNAEKEKERWDNDGYHYQMQRTEWAGEQSKVKGILTSKDQELSREINEYESEYKDAARRYKETHIMVETTKAAIEDLGRYGGALDGAIMRFHEMKMEEINRIVEELWRKTYQGTDVDTIMIRSENEAARGNKSYNYRVVMVKQDVEMDMRGRCSAGQKVLACIIIRLALAECFGVNCGLIALDEPTTNLDRDNIRALALSLAEIIRVRRAQRNFQLIVITHDEEFLQLMGCADFTDYYYRVSRDERQKSVIERQNINEVL